MDKFQTLGKVLWLYSCSPLHKEWPLDAAVSYVIPPIELGQYSLLMGDDGMPRGWASWAWLDKSAQERYILDPNSLKFEDWNSGDRLWFIDFISPFSFRDTINLRRKMGEVHGNNYLARSIRLRKDGKAEVVEHSGGSVDMSKSRALADELYIEASEIFKKR